MWRAVALFWSVLALAHGQTTEVSQCTSSAAAGPLPINAYIAGCETPPCQLPQLQDAVINIIFRAPRTLRNMRTLATAFLPFNIPIPYGLGDNAETCNFLVNTYCPVIEGEVIQYKLNMYIEPFFPVGTSVNVEFRIVDDNNTAIMCIRVPIRIAPPVDDGRIGAHNGTLTEE